MFTKADLESENYLIKQIHKKYKNHSIIAEESGLIKKNGNYTWIIDPLDGTTNFAHNLPIFAVSLGLVNKKMKLYVQLFIILLQKNVFMHNKIKDHS